MHRIEGAAVHHMIGTAERSINSLLQGKEVEIINPHNGNHAGLMVIDRINVIEKPTFL